MCFNQQMLRMPWRGDEKQTSFKENVDYNEIGANSCKATVENFGSHKGLGNLTLLAYIKGKRNRR